MRTKLSESEISAAVDELPGWRFVDGVLKAQFEFASFLQAIDFIVRLAAHSEAVDHHATILNLYSTVDLELCTHDVGGVTRLDLDFARQANLLAEQPATKDTAALRATNRVDQ